MIIPTGYAQVNFRYSGLAAPLGAENVIGVDNNLDLGPADIAAAAITAWTDNIAALCVNDLTLSSVLVKLGPNETGLSAEVGSGQTGASGSAGMTPQNALLVHKVSTRGGRKGRGRLYLPGITEGTADESGNIASGTVAIYQAGFDGFLADMDSATLPIVLLHGDSTSPSLVTALTVDARIATQRRRNRK